MSDYEAIAAYAGFALVLFALVLVWRSVREVAKKRFHLLNYHSKDDAGQRPLPFHS